MARKTAPAAEPAAGERLVRRYANRKLYDVQAGRYVDLAALARLVGRGTPIRVVEQRTGEDITSPVLAQILLEGLRERTATIPEGVLLRLVRAAYGPRPQWMEWLDTGKAATRAKTEAERIASGLLSRGRLTLDDAVALRHEIARSLHRAAAEAQSGLEAQLRRVTGDGPRKARRPARPARGRTAKARKEKRR